MKVIETYVTIFKLTAMVNGLLISYMRIILEDTKMCDFNTLAYFLFHQLRTVAQMYIKEKLEPFFVTSPWQVHVKKKQLIECHFIQLEYKRK